MHTGLKVFTELKLGTCFISKLHGPFLCTQSLTRGIGRMLALTMIKKRSCVRHLITTDITAHTVFSFRLTAHPEFWQYRVWMCVTYMSPEVKVSLERSRAVITYKLLQ